MGRHEVGLRGTTYAWMVSVGPESAYPPEFVPKWSPVQNHSAFSEYWRLGSAAGIRIRQKMFFAWYCPVRKKRFHSGSSGPLLNLLKRVTRRNQSLLILAGIGRISCPPPSLYKCVCVRQDGCLESKNAKQSRVARKKTLLIVFLLIGERRFLCFALARLAVTITAVLFINDCSVRTKLCLQGVWSVHLLKGWSMRCWCAHSILGLKQLHQVQAQYCVQRRYVKLLHAKTTHCTRNAVQAPLTFLLPWPRFTAANDRFSRKHPTSRRC